MPHPGKKKGKAKAKKPATRKPFEMHNGEMRKMMREHAGKRGAGPKMRRVMS